MMLTDSNDNAATLCVEEMDVFRRDTEVNGIAGFADVAWRKARLQLMPAEVEGDERVGAQQFDNAGNRLEVRHGSVRGPFKMLGADADRGGAAENRIV